MEKKYEIKLVFLLFVCLFVIKSGNIAVKNQFITLPCDKMATLEDLSLPDPCCPLLLSNTSVGCLLLSLYVCSIFLLQF